MSTRSETECTVCRIASRFPFPLHSLPAPCSQRHRSWEPFQNITYAVSDASVSFPSALQNSITAIGTASSGNFSLKSCSLLMLFQESLHTNESSPHSRVLTGVDQQLNNNGKQKLNKLSSEREIFFSKTSEECHDSLCVARNAQESTKKALCSPLSADDMEPGKLFQPEGCGGTWVWQRKEVCVFQRDEGAVPDVCSADPTLHAPTEEQPRPTPDLYPFSPAGPNQSGCGSYIKLPFLDSYNDINLQEGMQSGIVPACGDLISDKETPSSVANVCPMMYVGPSSRWSPLKSSAGRVWPQPPKQEPFLHSPKQRSLSVAISWTNPKFPTI